MYRLIRLRTLASQLADAVYAVRTVRLGAEMDGKETVFEANGRVLSEPGWRALTASDAAMVCCWTAMDKPLRRIKLFGGECLT